MNAIAIYMSSGMVLSSFIAAAKDRSVVFWAVFGIIAGPIAVAVVMWLPSRRPVAPPRHPPYAMRSIADEIDALDDMRQRGMITDSEFAQGKAQILAWPVTSPIPPALSPQRVIADGRRTWASYQPATRAAFTNLGHRHHLDIHWGDDLPFEVLATYPAQLGLSLAFTLALEKGVIHCWGEGWDLESAEIGRPDKGIPGDLDQALDALIEGTGRIVVRTAYGTKAPFHISLQMLRNDRWRTVRRRFQLPWPPLWQRRILMNDPADKSTDVA
jgi:hypothetical protein